MLTLNFKILPKTLVTDTLGVNHLLMSRLTLNFKIVAETLVSDTRGSIIFDVNANSLTLKL